MSDDNVVPLFGEGAIVGGNVTIDPGVVLRSAAEEPNVDMVAVVTIAHDGTVSVFGSHTFNDTLALLTRGSPTF